MFLLPQSVEHVGGHRFEDEYVCADGAARTDDRVAADNRRIGIHGDVVFQRGVARLILLTKSHQLGEGEDDAWIIDIDLAIFAQPIKRVLEYERQIRAEYAWVPQAVYAEKRAEILTGFLKREQIYLTAWSRERYESQARENLRALIESI